MSGHSKWHSIKHQKGAADAKRGAVFSKLANAITVAARNGADPEMNFQLRLAVDRARAANMPKDNIERAIDKVKGGGASAMEEITFEAYGPGGTAFLIETATDNRNRSVGDIRAVLNKYDAKLAESGSVGYLFKKRGQIVLENVDPETAELAAIEAGAEDFETEDSRVFIYTDPKELEHVRRSLATAGFESNEVSFEFHPTTTVPITDDKLSERIIKLATALDDLDDVTKVSSNFELNN
ncbi:MAG: YebC/PmpR family DNA-binding transcriptional regulator [Candidatus Berkelbacteria bacterium]|nr:YebC/PmpR family DNA-binding transcriptional regulator [Candidatus Berkelbacteria bacterium]